MKLPRLTVPIIAVLVIAILAGVTTTALVAARAQPPGPSPAAVAPPAQVDQSNTATPEPAPTIEVGLPPKQALELEKQPAPMPIEKEFEPKPVPKATQYRGPKGNRVPPGPVQTGPSQQVAKSGGTSGKDSDQGQVYTWEDGDRTMRAVLQEDLVVQDQSAITSDDDVVAGMGKDSIVRKQYKEGGDAGPVFKSESGGGLMTLPGGVMLLWTRSGTRPRWTSSSPGTIFRQTKSCPWSGWTTGSSWRPSQDSRRWTWPTPWRPRRAWQSPAQLVERVNDEVRMCRPFEPVQVPVNTVTKQDNAPGSPAFFMFHPDRR